MTIFSTFIFAILYIVAMVLVGVHCVDYTIWAVTGQNIHFLGDLLLALLFGSFFVPAAIVLWLLGVLGLAYPLMVM